MDSKTLLKNAGLTGYEAVVYIILLKEGPSEATELSKKSKVPMGKIYETLSNLKDKGFVEIQQSIPKKYHPIIAEVALRNLYLKKKEKSKIELEKFKSNIPEIEQSLSNIQNTGVHKIFLTYLSYEDHIKSAKYFYSEARKEICEVLSVNYKNGMYDQFENTIDIWWENYIKLVKKGIKIRSIAPYSEDQKISFSQFYESIDDEILKDHISLFWDVKYLDTKHHFYLVDDHLVLQHIENQANLPTILGTLKIYNKEYNKELTKKFDELWEKAEYLENFP